MKISKFFMIYQYKVGLMSKQKENQFILTKKSLCCMHQSKIHFWYYIARTESWQTQTNFFDMHASNTLTTDFLKKNGKSIVRDEEKGVYFSALNIVICTRLDVRTRLCRSGLHFLFHKKKQMTLSFLSPPCGKGHLPGLCLFLSKKDG